jgi:hypothetical protein
VRFLPDLLRVGFNWLIGPNLTRGATETISLWWALLPVCLLFAAGVAFYLVLRLIEVLVESGIWDKAVPSVPKESCVQSAGSN